MVKLILIQIFLLLLSVAEQDRARQCTCSPFIVKQILLERRTLTELFICGT